MAPRRSGALLVSVIVSGLLLVPAPAAARQPGGALRGGLSAIARGGLFADARIESRPRAAAPEIAVAVELGGQPDQLTRERLRAAGLDPRGAWRTTIEGYVAPDRLRELSEVLGVSAIMPIRRPLSSAYVGPAPALHGALSWQQAGHLGTGVKIGILDVSFSGFAELMGSELPATVAARCYRQLGSASSAIADCVARGETHGTAVAESIIDMAPGATLYVSNAYSQADIAATIRWMTDAGVRVINFSQGAMPQGMGDGTSIYPNSGYALVDQAVAGGALFVASAGNEGETSWMGPATDADGNGWLDFAPGEDTDSLDLRAGDPIMAAIRWGSPASDYDLSIWREDDELIESADLQAETRDPSEFLGFMAPATGTYEIRIRHAAGPTTPTMRLMVHVMSQTVLEHRTTAGSLPTPADSRNPGLIAVGAVNFQTPSIIEPYSSRGPTLDGRTKPDLVAADCAPTTIEPVFCGTSEAAPFVTGAAALILEADPSLTPASLAGLLERRATGLDSPVPNNTFGHGLLALGPAPLTVGPPGAPTGVAAAAGDGSALVSWVAPASDGGSPITGYTATSVPDGKTCATTGLLSCTVTGMANGTPYTFTVTAGNAIGAGPASAPSAPVTPAAVPGAPTGVSATAGDASAFVSWVAPVSDGGSPITGYTVTASPGGATCVTAGALSCSVTGLANGTSYTFVVVAGHGVGPGIASSPSGPVVPGLPVAVLPRGVITALPTWLAAASVPLRWSAVAGSSAVASYDVRYRRAAWNGGFGPFAAWRSATSATSTTFRVAPGYTYCFSVRARDTLGALSTWTAETCTAIPLDDRSLVRSSGWTAGSSSSFYRSTSLRSPVSGAKLVRTGVVARRVAIVATTCPTCGSVAVYWGSTLVRTINLRSAATVNRKIMTAVTFPSIRSGTLTIKVRSSARTVIIDGIAIRHV